MARTLEQLRRHLAGPTLAPVYLIAGEEHLLVLEAADAVRARARELDFAERVVLEAGESGFDWQELARAGANLSLFASRKLIDLRLPSGKPGKEGAEAITTFCASGPPDTALLITTNAWSKAHETAWVAAVEDAGFFVAAWPLKRNELPEWIRARAAGRGVALAPDAIELLIERIEGNLLAAAQEIDKLALLTPIGATGADGGAARRVDAAMLEDLVADHSRFDVFALTDAALAGDAARAVRIVRHLRGEGEQVPGLLGWLVTQLNVVAKLAAKVEGGTPAPAAMQAERVWPQRQPIYRSALSRGGAAFWEARLAQAADVERIGKGRAAGDVWLAFERLVAAIADAKVARAVA
jgi:DNA polymerase-3 subunit delta